MLNAEQNTMGIREKLRGKPILMMGMSGLFVVAAIGILIHSYWPEKKANLSQAFYTDDEGQTWFVDSTFLVAPFQHNGKTAVVAEMYTYDDGKKKFCAYLAQFTPEAKKRLEAALADAQKAGRPPESVELYHDPNFMKHGTLVKLPGANHPWISYDDPKANEIFTIHSPDGSAVDQCFVY